MSSTTTTTAVRVDLFSAPPPTNNTLKPEERSRLLRSTRKLGAVLGTTPLLLEPETEAATIPSTATPKRAVRREGRIFHSPSSSISSTSTVASSPESDYVFVKSNTRSAPYQVQAVFENASPSASRSASPLHGHGPTSGFGATAPVSRNLKRKQGPEGALAPITVMAGSGGSKQTRFGSSLNQEMPKDLARAKGVAGGQGSQPLLLHVRAGPAQISAIKPDVHSNSPPQPLSPVSSTFNTNMNVDALPSPLLGSSSNTHGLTDREKRRKMAKLTRTLGENIPPELVFRAPTFTSPPSASSSGSPVQLSRRMSISISRTPTRPSMNTVFDPLAPFHRPTKFSTGSRSSATASAPPLAVAAPPRPAPSPSPSETKRRHRPRSLTLGSSSAIAAATATLLQREQQTRGTTSLDMPPPHSQTQTQDKAQAQPSPNPFVGVAPLPLLVEKEKVSEKAKTHGPSLSSEFGRRKEREWSGEWNLKDMGDVAKKLRGLKGR